MEDYDDSDRSALGDEGCLFPDRCCMPGEHYTSECHTPEDFEAMMTEATLWALLIPGPDDVWAMPSREAADEAARKHNELVDRDDWPFPDLRESSRAKVIEWPYDAASHAEALANDEPETLSSNDLGIPDGAAVAWVACEPRTAKRSEAVAGLAMPARQGCQDAERKAERPTRAARKVNVSTDLASPCGSDSSDLLGFNAESSPRVLDPASGSRMMWFDRDHPDVVFGDKRRETVTVTDRSHGRADGTRTLTVDPDALMDFRALPFDDGTFRLVAFDPPHLVRAGPRSWLAAKYGKLGQDWRDDLRQGFAECFRVLHPDGVLVFKWNETQVKLSEVLALVPYAPLFGNTSGKKAGTHWLVFMKPNAGAKRAPATK